MELFNCLESNQPHIVDDAKKKLHQIFNITKEAWLLSGLFDYYLSTNSARAIEILVSVREPHDKYLFDRLCESLKSSAAKLQALTVLGHVLRRQPAWLYKITQHQLLKDLLKLLKTETDILPLLSALLVIVVLLPMIPALLGPFLHEIFDIFSRLAAWNCNPGKLGEEQLVHLQVAMYALFLRLYGMYPCNFLSYLRNHYRQGDNMPVFMHTVKPMLGTVKIHPHLVTASKDNETETVRWMKMGHHDVIVECEKFAVDVSGAGTRDDSCYMGLTSSFRSRSSTVSTAAVDHPLDVHIQQSLKYSAAGDKDFWSPTNFFNSQHSSSPPPVPVVCAPQSIPQTPNSLIPNSQAFVASSVFPHQEGTSPPEAAIEATPETTPIKDPRMMTDRSLPPVTSNVARALTTLNSTKWSSLGASTGSTPSHSQPSSPMRKEPSPFRFPTEGSAFETQQQSSHRKEILTATQSKVNQKLFRIMQERTQVNESPLPTSTTSTARGKTPVAHIPTSPLRVIPRYHQDTQSSVPHSPVPLVDGPGTREWPPVARPRPEKNGLPVTVGTETSQEDQEVLEIVRQGEMHSDSTRTQLCDSVLQEFVSHGDDAEYEMGECCGEAHELQHKGSPCTSGGLHMPNSHSLHAFATRVQRLRYYSQCGPVHDYSESSAGSSPGQNLAPAPNAKVRRANSCPEMKKNYSGSIHPHEHIGKALDESDELNMDALICTPAQESSKHMSNGVNERRPPQRSTSTQTLDLWPMPYEHLFLGIFPLLETNTEVKPSPSPSPAPFALFDKSVRFSPYEMLDKYVEQASHGYEHDGKRSKVHSLESEIKNLREQLGLVHLQLQYERHRREVHAVRNRRLLGESRNNKALEEHNSALRDQVSLLQKEIEHLNDELTDKKQEFNYREKELQDVVSYWHEQCLVSQEANKSLRASNDTLQREIQAQIRGTAEVHLQHQTAAADVFRLEAEMGVALHCASQSERLRAELEHLQRELLLSGELNQRYRERLDQWPLMEHRHEEARMLAEAYSEEVRGFQQQLESKTSLIEAQKAHLQELEHATQQRDELYASQKRMLKEVKEEYHEQLCAVESKYETQRNINKSMEERILELWQRIETLSRTRTVHSPDTSSCHEAGSVDRAASAAAGLSPHSSPLSASLASSEGSMAFLQQQQQEIKNLQVIVDQSETSLQLPAPSGSEETTPDGNNPCFLYNHSD
ncbi:Tsc1 [Carabus blaptoides fortunei]